MKRKLIIVFFITAGLLLGWTLYQHGIIWFNMPSRSHYPVRGIDVSHHQGNINWQSVRAERIDFVYIKATEGKDYTDPQFKSNMNGAVYAGLKCGAYHFFTFCSSGKEQADHFIATTQFKEITLRPAVDVEFGGNCRNTPSQEILLSELKIFINAIKSYYKCEPVIYATAESYDFLIKNNFKENIWIRDVYTKPDNKINWIIWQYHCRGKIDGINGPVDLNALNPFVTLSSLNIRENLP